MTDISAIELMERQTQEEALAHAHLLRVQQRIADLQQPLEQVLEQAARAACEITGAAGAVIALRGEAPLDVQALSRIAVAVGQVVAGARGAIASLDLNPVMVGAAGEGAVVVDALVEVSKP